MQLAFYFDQTRCVGCYTCSVACKDWNDVPAGSAKWRRISQMEDGEFPNPFVAYLSAACNHCVDPICATVCPSGAITKRDDGIVSVNRDKCREAAHCGIITGYQSSPSLPMGERQSPCQVTCPAHIKVPGFIALIAKGKFKEALELIRLNMPLPSVCGRICSHPCEVECTRKDLDEPLAIRSLRRFVADYAYNAQPKPVSRTRKEKVAIVGSGPAGLSAAYDLIRKGYGVTIFEALPVAGGMLAVGVPEYRLPKDVLQRDISYIQGLGVEIRLNCSVGPQLTLDDLAHQGYSAIFLGVGSHKSAKLDIQGLELKGIVSGISFLRDFRMGKEVKVGKRVVVLGGGNVAFDCARTAIRLGALEVCLVCPESKKKMRAFPEEIVEGKQEGISIYPSRVFSRIVGRDGVAVGVECSKVRSMKFDEDGKLHVSTVAASQQTLPSDTVIVAIGQIPDLDFLKVIGGLKTASRGTIAVDPETMGTSRPGIFAGGDAVLFGGTAIDAIAAGQRAAVYIDRYLRGEVLKGGAQSTPIRASNIKVVIPTEIKKSPRQSMPLLPSGERVDNFDEVASGFDEKMAIAEAQRCLNCAGSLCRDVCPYGAPQFGAEENAKMQMCNLCIDRWTDHKPPICVGACPMRALDAGTVEELKAKYGEATEATGFAYSEVTKPPTLFKPKRQATFACRTD